MRKHEKFEGVYWAFDSRGKRFLATKNRFKGFHVSDERVERIDGDEYRFWEPSRSKLAAAIVKGMQTMPIKPGSQVLYLGAANGITSSYVSDIVGPKGVVYCVEFSAQAMEDLIFVCEKRDNMFPILADARFPERYASLVSEKVDVVYEDVADKAQDSIMTSNAKAYLKKGGYGMIGVKARCIDSTADPKRIFAQMRESLQRDFEIVEAIDIEPFEMDHEFLVLKMG